MLNLVVHKVTVALGKWCKGTGCKMGTGFHWI